MGNEQDPVLLLAPELASPDWSGGFLFATDLLKSSDELVLTALILGRPIIMPAAALDALKREAQHGYLYGSREKASNVRDCIYLLRDEGYLRLEHFTEDIQLAEAMSGADSKAAWDKGVAYVSGGKTLYVTLPGTNERYCLGAGISGLSQNLGATTNFVILAQQGYGAEYMKLRTLVDFDLEGFLKLKAFLWEIDPPTGDASLLEAHDVLSLYLPLRSVASERRQSFLDPDLLRRIGKLRRTYADALDGWRAAVSTLRRAALAERRDEQQLSVPLPLPVYQALEHELQHFTRGLLISGLTVILSSIAAKAMGSWFNVGVLGAKVGVLGMEWLELRKIKQGIPFFFWLERVKAIVEEHHN